MKTAATLILSIFALVCASPTGAPAMLADSFGSGANQFDIEFVFIGNANNPADNSGLPRPAVGKVKYAYRMGKFEISRDMITKANNEGGLGITLDPMGFVIGGARDDMPATEVSWFEAATFVNWLNTSQGHQAAYNFDGDGNFQLWSSAEAWQKGGENLFRHKDAWYFLLDVDEWYKAAYYDPNTGVYYDYPTGSDAKPAAVASGTAANTAVYDQLISQGPADITMAGGLSPYGTMGQGGNVVEWEETPGDANDPSSPARFSRGGFWYSSPEILRSVHRAVGSPNGQSHVGFRVASIPEPGAMLMGVLATGGFLVRRRRLTNP